MCVCVRERASGFEGGWRARRGDSGVRTPTDSSPPPPASKHCHSLHVWPATQSESLKQSIFARFMSSGTQATYGEFSSL